METATMGRVVVPAKILSLNDLILAHKQVIGSEQVRSVEVTDALIVTEATNLAMPKRLIDQLDLLPLRSRLVRTSAGPVMVNAYGAVRLIVQERECTCDVVEVPDDCPVLIGQVPLELLDFVVDPVNRRLIGNPEHGGVQMLEMY